MRLKYGPLFLFALFLSGFSRAQNLDWVHHLGDQDRCISFDLAVDSAANVYTIGTFRGTIDFDPNPIESLILSANGNADMYVSKHDSSGNLLWAYSFSSNLDYELGRKIATDRYGNVYICGLFIGSMDADPDTGIFNLQDSGVVDAFIIKLDSTGALAWAKNIGSGSAVVSPFGLSVGADDYIYIAGYFTDTVDLDPGPGLDLFFRGPGSFSFTEIGFTAKFDNNGNYVWGRKFGGEHSQSMRVNSVTADPFGNVLVGGQFKGTQDFDGGPDSLILVSSTFKDDLFLTKLNSQGNISWLRQFVGTADRFLSDMATDHKGNVYLTGSFNGFFDIDPGQGVDSLLGVVNTEGYFTSLDSAGIHRWGGALISNNTGRASAIAVDQNQYVYITGEFTQTLDADPGPSQASITARGGVDAFIGIYDHNGRYRSVRQITSSVGNEFSRGIAVDKGGNIYSTGTFNWLCDFDPRANDSLNLTPFGVEDIFIHKMIPCTPSFSSISDTACDSLIAPSAREVWSQSGIYTDTLINKDGCDSIITINLTIRSIARDTLSLTACDSILGPGSLGWLNSSGVYRDTLSRISGCDSIILLNLIIYPSTRDTLVINACDSLRSPSGNHLYLNSGFYVDSLQTVNGCDSLLYIDLNLSFSSIDTFNIFACDSIQGPNGNWRSVNGLYLDSLQSLDGCDSIVYTNLTLFNSASYFIQDTVCDAYPSPSGNYLWTNSGTYFDTLSTSNGCDSIIRFQLQVNYSSLDTVSINSCDEISSPSGRYTYSQSGFYNDTLSTSEACDSVLVIDFNRTQIDTSLAVGPGQLTSNQSMGQYQWLDCDAGYTPISGATAQTFQPIENGLYAVEITLNNCVDTSTCVVVADVNLLESEIDGLKVYPNPFSERFEIAFPAEQSRVELQIIDMQGKQILCKLYSNTQRIELSPRLPKGVYLLKLNGKDWSSQQRIVRN